MHLSNVYIVIHAYDVYTYIYVYLIKLHRHFSIQAKKVSQGIDRIKKNQTAVLIITRYLLYTIYYILYCYVKK